MEEAKKEVERVINETVEDKKHIIIRLFIIFVIGSYVNLHLAAKKEYKRILFSNSLAKKPPSCLTGSGSL
jgi:hypothetical protein